MPAAWQIMVEGTTQLAEDLNEQTVDDGLDFKHIG